MKDATRGPIFACLYPGLCDVARRHGYALAIHGTLVDDMDLVAVPWTEDAVDAVTLKDALMCHIGACGYDELLKRDSPWLTEDQRRQVCEQQGIRFEGDHSEKPHGRLAAIMEEKPFMIYRNRDPETGEMDGHFTVVNEDEQPRRGHSGRTLMEAFNAAFHEEHPH